MTIDEQMFFDGKPGALALYEAFREKLLALCPDAAFQVQKTQITFRNPRVFCCVSTARMKGIQGEYIVVTLGLGQRLASPRVWVATEPYPGRWTHHVPVWDVEELDEELMDWVRQAYTFSREKRPLR